MHWFEIVCIAASMQFWGMGIGASNVQSVASPARAFFAERAQANGVITIYVLFFSLVEVHPALASETCSQACDSLTYIWLTTWNCECMCQQGCTRRETPKRTKVVRIGDIATLMYYKLNRSTSC